MFFTPGKISDILYCCERNIIFQHLFWLQCMLKNNTNYLGQNVSLTDWHSLINDKFRKDMLIAIVVKAAYSVTMNIFRKILVSF